MLVYLNGKEPGDARQQVEVEVVQKRKSIVIVRLPDGNIISRKINRDIPKMEEKDETKSN